eukprot:7527301-Alexandrium_andersonii.AAC.1
MSLSTEAFTPSAGTFWAPRAKRCKAWTDSEAGFGRLGNSPAAGRSPTIGEPAAKWPKSSGSR